MHWSKLIMVGLMEGWRRACVSFENECISNVNMMNTDDGEMLNTDKGEVWSGAGQG